MAMFKREQEHVQQFVKDLRLFYQQKSLADVIILCSDGEIQCHSVFLAAVSPLLRTVLSSRKIPAEQEQHFQILLPDFTQQDVDRFIQWTLCEEENGNISQEEVDSLANILQIFITQDSSKPSDLKEEVLFDEDDIDAKCETKLEDDKEVEEDEDYVGEDKIVEEEECEEEVKYYVPNKRKKRNVAYDEDDHYEVVDDDEGGRPYHCRHCDYATTEKYQMREHVRRHTGDKQFHCQYPGCGMSFPGHQNLWRHNKSHMTTWPFTCSVCSKGFLEKRDMMVHMKTHDESRKTMARYLPKDMVALLDTEDSVMFDGREVKAATVCPLCYKIFDKPFMMRRHKATVHQGISSSSKEEESRVRENH